MSSTKKMFAVIFSFICVNLVWAQLPEQCLHVPTSFCRCVGHYQNDRQLYEELHDYYKPIYSKLLTKTDEQIGDKVGGLLNNKICAPPLTREAIYSTVLDQCGISGPSDFYNPIWRRDKWEIIDKCKWIAAMSNNLCRKLKQTFEAFGNCDLVEVYNDLYGDPLRCCVEDCGAPVTFK